MKEELLHDKLVDILGRYDDKKCGAERKWAIQLKHQIASNLKTCHDDYLSVYVIGGRREGLVMPQCNEDCNAGRGVFSQFDIARLFRF